MTTPDDVSRPDLFLTDDVLESIEEKLREIAELDPADLPEPAAELAEMLGRVLEEVDET